MPLYYPSFLFRCFCSQLKVISYKAQVTITSLDGDETVANDSEWCKTKEEAEVYATEYVKQLQVMGERKKCRVSKLVYADDSGYVDTQSYVIESSEETKTTRNTTTTTTCPSYIM